uniref:AAA domain-containing protein n=1 Tax=Candidatus Kentrum sp. DK TaxID=2126562 RepID=A0A450SNJ9_9GAMM|nr:MAG: AAA domain-containing protein [Candidatus Kentron sp. DK]VFJ55445.1 MAG: AAA domain-containing protein [Candidatus Kentron sp. DK]
MAKVISIFNHKGGVSKTTTTFHLGWKMASLGKKILIVDADPQCNLTGLTLGLDDYSSLSDFYDSKKNTDIFNSLAPEFNIDSVSASQDRGTIPIKETKNRNMFILAGNIRFSELDTQIATALTSGDTIPVLKRFVGSINRLIRDAANKNGIDIVLVDMSPSVSATNHCILMGSDYFIIPISPDFYCYQAIDSLSNVLPSWAEKINKFRQGYGDFILPSREPRMLGVISQNYRIYTVDSRRENTDQKTMSKAYRDWLDKIHALTNSKLVPTLREHDMVISEDIFKGRVTYDSPYHLAGVQNFSGLIPVSQRLSKPIYELTAQDGNWSGGRWENIKNGVSHGIKVNIEDANRMYTELSRSIIGMIEDDRYP